MTHKHLQDDMTAEQINELNVMQKFLTACREATALVHKRNAKWWISLETGERITRNFGEIIALCHSELSEALEGHRKNLADDKLTSRPMVEVELADCMIRLMDAAGGFGYDLAGAWYEKMQYNVTRHDHTIDCRKAVGGKAY